MILKYIILKCPLSRRGRRAIPFNFYHPPLPALRWFLVFDPLINWFSSTNPLRKSVIFQESSEKSQTFDFLVLPLPPPPEIPVNTMSHATNKIPKKFLKNFSPFLRKVIVCSHCPSKSETFTTPLRNLILPGVCQMKWHQFL